ncbi:MAG: hypothetical protein JWL62_1708, partial [Hyphomicrobiales bacterium]|nr:hypothetical protein [Hyphomicrobiales bacterium]
IPIHRSFLSEAVNHKAILMPTILWVWALVRDAFALYRAPQSVESITLIIVGFLPLPCVFECHERRAGLTCVSTVITCASEANLRVRTGRRSREGWTLPWCTSSALSSSRCLKNWKPAPLSRVLSRIADYHVGFSKLNTPAASS